MIISSSQIVSITEANQNFNQVLKKAKASGDVIIFKRNKPAYIIIDINAVGEPFIDQYEALKETHKKKESSHVKR